MITGTPTTAIVLAIGRGEGVEREIRSAADAVMAPVSSEAGSMTLCDEVLNMPLAICGATIPTKPIGPQKLVTADVIKQQLMMDRSLILRTGAPAMDANSSPNRMMSRPLILQIARVVPAARTIANIPISFHPLLEKLPADQL